MTLFALSGLLLGAILGFRFFTVFALIPAMTGTIAIAAMSSIIGGGDAGPTTVNLALLLIFLQIGYLAGAAVQFSVHRMSGRMEPPSSEGQLPRVRSH
jgi:hypothetical protein